MPILNWLGRDDALKTATNTPYRLLEEVPELGYGDKTKENMIIQGDNLEALKALLPFYAGQVKCIYIDPPYNSCKAEDILYDDNIEHSQWLSIMYPRLELLYEFLREDGTIFVQLDDDEIAYMKIILDEIFGRNNFINQVSVKMKQSSGASGGGEDKRLKKNIEYILIYAKNMNAFTSFNPLTEEQDLFELIEEMREDGKSWKYTRVMVSLGNREFFKEIQDGTGKPIKIYKHSNVIMKNISDLMKEENLSEEDCYIKYFDRIFRDTNAQSSIRTRVQEANEGYEFVSIDYYPISGKNKDKLTTLYYKGLKCDLLAWLSDVAIKKKNSIVKLEKLGTYWDGFPLNNLTKEGNVRFPNGKKPESLINRVLELATNKDDLVLDSFLGSGTTAAVAHKMGRRYIGVEMGNHAITHCVPRLKAVIDGERSGISKSVNWQGGGGFRFYKLGEQIFDADGCINENISFENLSAHIWFTETKTPFNKPTEKSTYLGTCDNVSYALLYNGILRDKRVDGGNVLTNKTLNVILDDMKHQPYEKLVIYGESSRISPARLKTLHIEFKQTPYDIKAR
ncbi:MAG: site-specific DNA-methyltransferase [Alphaproteobacteria bacterium]|nr:site-specific DNA-methyltransferase [Alphaproteobacteria bacterium]